MESATVVLSRIASEQHGIISFAQARRTGLPRKTVEYQLQDGPWQRLYRGIYRNLATPLTWESRLMAACFTGGEGTVASHRSAAALYGLPGGTKELVEITCRRWNRTKHPPLVAHESKALDGALTTTVDGIPATTVERTLLDLGAVRGSLSVQMALDRAIRLQLTTWQRIEETLSCLARSGRPGVVKLRNALLARAARPIPESEQETALLVLLEGAGFPTPAIQHVIRDQEGSFTARVDAAYPRRRVALEYDSDQEHTDPAALARDNARRNRLIAAGWTVISARKSDLVHGGAEFLRAVDQALASVVPD